MGWTWKQQKYVGKIINVVQFCFIKFSKVDIKLILDCLLANNFLNNNKLDLLDLHDWDINNIKSQINLDDFIISILHNENNIINENNLGKYNQDFSKFPNIDQTLLVDDGITNSSSIQEEASTISNSEFYITLKKCLKFEDVPSLLDEKLRSIDNFCSSNIIIHAGTTHVWCNGIGNILSMSNSHLFFHNLCSPIPLTFA